MPNAWINHVKQFARENNLTYGCAISDQRCKSSYKKPVKQKTQKAEREDMGSNDVNVPRPSAPETKTFRKKRPAPAPAPAPAPEPETKTFRKKRPASAPEPETKTFRKKRPAPPAPPPPPAFVPPPPPQTLASYTEPRLTKQQNDLLQETKKIFRDFTRGVRTGNSNIDYMNESIAREYAKKIEADYAKRRADDYAKLIKNMKTGGPG